MDRQFQHSRDVLKCIFYKLCNSRRFVLISLQKGLKQSLSCFRVGCLKHRLHLLGTFAIINFQAEDVSAALIVDPIADQDTSRAHTTIFAHLGINSVNDEKRVAAFRLKNSRYFYHTKIPYL